MPEKTRIRARLCLPLPRYLGKVIHDGEVARFSVINKSQTDHRDFTNKTGTAGEGITGAIVGKPKGRKRERQINRRQNEKLSDFERVRDKKKHRETNNRTSRWCDPSAMMRSIFNPFLPTHHSICSEEQTGLQLQLLMSTSEAVVFTCCGPFLIWVSI